MPIQVMDHDPVWLHALLFDKFADAFQTFEAIIVINYDPPNYQFIPDPFGHFFAGLVDIHVYVTETEPRCLYQVRSLIGEDALQDIDIGDT